MLVLATLGCLLAAAPPNTTVTPFRTEVTPRVDPVFGDIASLRQSVDRFLALQSEMDQVRNEFSTAVQGTLFELAPPGPRPKGCPAGAGSHYSRALAAGGRYLSLGRQLEARFREIRRSDELGDASGLTPDYRVKVKRARELYNDLLRDYREMRVAFYDQLSAEMRHAGCELPTAAARVAKQGDAAPDPSDPASWALEEPTPEAPPPATTPTGPHAARPLLAPNAAPAIWITVDNSRCAQKSNLAIDGTSLGAVSGHKKLTIRTRAGPHEVCVLPTTDKRACGDAGTLRKAYLSEGWTLVVRCER
ncbi:MAG TPA: hypothetical protein VN914_12475 [Polyangia bacterium]|nr:hypothetical protein [Polyangia bacterium]